MLLKQSEMLYLTDDYIQLLQQVETVDRRARESMNESSTFFSGSGEAVILFLN